MTETTHLALPYLAAAQAQKHVTHNEALARLDVVVQLAVLDSALTTPPGSPANGDRYLVAAGASEAWEDHDGEIAAFVDGAWLFFAPRPGWIVFDVAGEAVLVRHDDAWTAIGTFLGPIARLGVHTTADETNRLAVRSAAALFTALEAGEGGSGDLRLVANKETSADTVSLLFQSGFSGRAEVGLAGDDDLVFKVSADGVVWTEAIRVDGATGLPSVAYDNAGSGLAATTLHGAIDEIADGAVLGPASADDGAPVLFDGTTGRLVRESSFADFKAALLLGKADVGLGNVLDVPQRERLTGARTYYVRSDGSDGNDGLTDDAGGAFLTIQKAVDTVAALDRSTYGVTIQVGAGSFANVVVSGWGPGSQSVVINGAGAGSTTIAGSNVTALRVTNARVTIQNAALTTSGSFGHCIYAGPGAFVLFGSVAFGAAINAHVFAEGSSRVVAAASYAITGSALAHVYARYTGASVEIVGVTITLTGTPAFSAAFALATMLAQIELGACTFSGAATGTRYVASRNAVLSVSGGGATYLPGSGAGATNTGGLYV